MEPMHVNGCQCVLTLQQQARRQHLLKPHTHLWSPLSRMCGLSLCKSDAVFFWIKNENDTRYASLSMRKASFHYAIMAAGAELLTWQFYVLTHFWITQGNMNLLFTHSYHLPLSITCTCLSPALAGYFLQHFMRDHTMQRAGASGRSTYKRAGTFCFHTHSSTPHQQNVLSLSARPGKVKLLACKGHFKKKDSSQFKNFWYYCCSAVG